MLPQSYIYNSTEIQPIKIFKIDVTKIILCPLENMSAITEGMERVYKILEQYRGGDPVFYEEGIGMGYSVAGRKKNGKIKVELFDYSSYEPVHSNFVQGYARLDIQTNKKRHTSILSPR